VKTGQIISTRVDIFPVEYTSKLASTLDGLDPLPASVIRGDRINNFTVVSFATVANSNSLQFIID
jgi:hypothetical protein